MPRTTYGGDLNQRDKPFANAVYHATGKRVRDLPITLDKLRR
jgi:hypothetical protein